MTMNETNRKRLNEALDILDHICADVEEEYPIGCLRVRKLLLDAIADKPDDAEMMELTAEPPQPAE